MPARIRRCFGTTAAAVALAIPLAAQSTTPRPIEEVGTRSVSERNPFRYGSAVLQATVFYPAQRNGRTATFLPKPGGRPVLLFLHGYDRVGREYAALGRTFAAAGWVVVLLDTSKRNPWGQVYDAAAWHGVLLAAATRTGSWFHGKVDARRVAAAGHSMGGADLLHLLAGDPYLSAGVSFGPYLGPLATYGLDAVPKIRTPLLVLAGTGAVFAPWARHAKPVFDRLKGAHTLGILHLFDQSVDHYNIAGLQRPGGQSARAGLAAAARVAQAFLNFAAYGDENALDLVLGTAARNFSQFAAVAVKGPAPLFFRSGGDRGGSTAHFQLAAAPGPAWYFFAAGTAGPFATPWGFFFLDPRSFGVLGSAVLGTSGFLDLPAPIPSDPRLRGLSFHFQALALSTAGLRWSNPVGLKLR